MQVFLLLFIVFHSCKGFAKKESQPWQLVTSEFTFEVRQFADDNEDETFENQRALKLRTHVEKEFGKTKFTAILSGRYDDQDPNRNLIWPEDVNIRTRAFGKYDLTAGYKIFNFSAMDAFNPLDSINARIFDVSIVNAEKMGELALGVSLEKFQGTLSFYLLPNPTRPVLPGSQSRINLEENLDSAIWMGSNDDEPDWDDHFLFSWEGMFGDWDALMIFSKGIDRSRTIVGSDDYRITAGNAIPNSTKFNTPYYYERYLTGINLVGLLGDDLLKFSAAHAYYLSETEIYTAEQALARSSDPEDLVFPPDYTSVALGYEHPLEHDSGMSSSLLAEYQSIFFAGGENAAGFPLANDLYLAWRINFNDINSKQLTFAGVYDLEGNQEGFVRLEYSQRFMEVFRIQTGVLEYMIPDDSSFTGYGIFRDTENAYLNLTYYL
ncbi:MAG: hypothetical protein CME65_00230 [Halobacteriovoraceae bacterium]|nr:hypothetical protein [Halobacteriovoraceae bacterium]|tara:strand:- start:8857 stop:10164 length:1308 start_codon:yes stop_codon:yes gene_type:complete